MNFDKTPAECGDRDVAYARVFKPHKEVNNVRIFDLSEDEVKEYRDAYNAADLAGCWAEAIN